MRRTFAALVIAMSLAGCGSPETMGPRPCSAWHCDLPASAPLAWTRPDGGKPGMLDISRNGDLCDRHAAKTPFALAGRFVVVFGIVPALAFAYIAFRIIWIYDRHGPGLAKLGEVTGRRVLFGVPIAVLLGWIALFVIRAW